LLVPAIGPVTSGWARAPELFSYSTTHCRISRLTGTDQTRYCPFVDMIRPSLPPGVMRIVISGIRLLTERFEFIYYRNWKVIQR
jgi:hypothetical protein